jgi:hypothetical protein
MTRRQIQNVAGSVHRRLLNIAKQTDRRFNDLVQYYADERWLYRLSQSQHGERFVLKAALMLLVWRTPVMRPTRDIDLLGRLSNDLESIRSVIAEVCQAPVEDDGLVFDPRGVTTDRIAEDADYEGVRAKFHGRLGNTRIAMQIDIGFSDVITPGSVEIVYPAILDQPAARLYGFEPMLRIEERFRKAGPLRHDPLVGNCSCAGQSRLAGAEPCRAAGQLADGVEYGHRRVAVLGDAGYA